MKVRLCHEPIMQVIGQVDVNPMHGKVSVGIGLVMFDNIPHIGRCPIYDGATSTLRRSL